MILAGDLTLMGRKMKAYMLLVGKAGGNKQLGRRRRRSPIILK
jgi:hypothetical protein